MQRIDGPTVSAALPAPRPTGTGPSAPGFFTRGDPIAGTPPTTLDADWANMVQEELLGPVIAAGIAPDKGNHGQLLTALQALFVGKGASDGGGAVIGNGQLSVPLGGGIILKAGQQSGSYSEQSVNVAFSAAFPSTCIVAVPVAINASASANHDIWAQLVSTSAGGFTVMLQYPGGTSNDQHSDGVAWIALGV